MLISCTSLDVMHCVEFTVRIVRLNRFERLLEVFPTNCFIKCREAEASRIPFLGDVEPLSALAAGKTIDSQALPLWSMYSS